MNVDIMLTQTLLINLSAFKNFYINVFFSVRLTGRPIGQSAIKTTKKMVCSIYTEPQRRDKFVRIKVFFVNAILDSVMVSCLALPKTNAYQCQICKHIFIFLFNLTSLSFII